MWFPIFDANLCILVMMPKAVSLDCWSGALVAVIMTLGVKACFRKGYKGCWRWCHPFSQAVCRIIIETMGLVPFISEDRQAGLMRPAVPAVPAGQRWNLAAVDLWRCWRLPESLHIGWSYFKIESCEFRVVAIPFLSSQLWLFLVASLLQYRVVQQCSTNMDMEVS